MGKIAGEYKFFNALPRQMRVLLLTNMVYAFVLPVIELFIGAYIIRNSQNISLVMVFQLAQGTGIPVTFILNGYLQRKFPIALLYSAGMMLSGICMGIMMLLHDLTMVDVAVTGF